MLKDVLSVHPNTSTGFVMQSVHSQKLGSVGSAKVRLFAFAVLGSFIVFNAEAQVSISGKDLFTETSLDYRAYANRYDPQDITGGTAYTVPSDLIGSAGADQYW